MAAVSPLDLRSRVALLRLPEADVADVAPSGDEERSREGYEGPLAGMLPDRVNPLVEPTREHILRLITQPQPSELHCDLAPGTVPAMECSLGRLKRGGVAEARRSSVLPLSPLGQAALKWRSRAGVTDCYIAIPRGA